ncbi:hypothetical protein ACSS6W_005814 [Trichoderma asperelloides]
MLTITVPCTWGEKISVQKNAYIRTCAYLNVSGGGRRPNPMQQLQSLSHGLTTPPGRSGAQHPGNLLDKPRRTVRADDTAHTR